MTNANVGMFVEALKELNPEKAADIMVKNFTTITYTGGDPRLLKSPYPFVWDEEEYAFSELPTLKLLGEPLIYQIFRVNCETKKVEANPP